MFFKRKKKNVKIDKPRKTSYANKSNKKIANNVWKIDDHKKENKTQS